MLNFVAGRRNCSEVETRKMDVDFVSRAIGDLYIEDMLVVVRSECRVQPDVGDWSTDHSPRVASLTAVRSHVRTCDVIHSNQNVASKVFSFPSSALVRFVSPFLCTSIKPYKAKGSRYGPPRNTLTCRSSIQQLWKQNFSTSLCPSLNAITAS